MKVVDLSKAQDVGSSCMLLEIGSFKILVDAGLHPKKVGADAVPNFSLIKPHSLDYIILTHCHLDHLGALPLAFRKQKDAKILTSVPSMTLAPRMLRNSYQVMLRQKKEENIEEYPLYTRMDINDVEKALMSMPYGVTKTFDKFGDKLKITFYSSGHIPGAAGCLIEYKHRKIFITGDVLFEDQLTLPGAQFPEGPFDTIIMETTRGATPRNDEKTRSSEIDRLIKVINHTLERNGSCLIPAFALGRMQEILSVLHAAKAAGKLRSCPIFCSGLGLDLVDYFENIAKKTGLIHFRKRIITQLKVKSLRLDVRPGEDMQEKGIYLLSSGMLIENTPSYLMAAALINHHHNSICFVGYCDPETPGGIIQNAMQEEEFLFKTLDYVSKVRAVVEKFDLTGHAERDELMDFVVKGNPRAVVLTHGDPPAREWFMNSIAQNLPEVKVINPIPELEIFV
ncbi:MAG: MBL fold metallo-hydrolase [Verrucomicrobia bacterium]|nr:MAG: MBL fold metallo-hydrolase [Verrucomicrobiota bacterium]